MCLYEYGKGRLGKCSLPQISLSDRRVLASTGIAILEWHVTARNFQPPALSAGSESGKARAPASHSPDCCARDSLRLASLLALAISMAV
jgi:hypothetical protein